MQVLSRIFGKCYFFLEKTLFGYCYLDKKGTKPCFFWFVFCFCFCFFIGSWLHIFLLRKVRKLFWLRERSFLWMVWQLTLLPWRFCWRATKKKLSWLVLLSLLYCRRGEQLFKRYTGKRRTTKNHVVINVHLGNSIGNFLDIVLVYDLSLHARHWRAKWHFFFLFSMKAG